MAAPEPGLCILLADDDADIRRTLGEHLRGQGHRVLLAADGSQALELVEREVVDIVITDVRMPQLGGFEVLAQVRARWPQVEVIVITAYGDVESAVRALREGAFDYFTKPFDIPDIAATLRRTARFQVLRRQNERYRERLERLEAEGRRQHGLEAVIGESAAVRQVGELVREVARTRATSVLITGETGTGKELVARAIHWEGSRAEGPFVAVDCTAVPETLIESAFYGHLRGAFTGAHQDHRGYFEQADGGTLFLDEIGDMAPSMQARLLRTLEERRVRRLGSDREIPVDVRVVSATHQDLKVAMARGAFREDLYYRLNTFVIHLPPLRERPEDILPLAHRFLELFARELRKNVRGFTPGAEHRLTTYGFPGNVRELRNMVERAAILCRGERLGEEDLDFDRPGAPSIPAAPPAGRAMPESLDLAENEKRLIQEALRHCGGNRARAARLLGISRDALRRRLERYGITE
jgi:DNA-binding NtrC family response regulator